MAGRIRAEDVQAVKERSSITDVVSEIRRSVFNLRNEATAGQRTRGQVHEQQRQKAQELEAHRMIPRLKETAEQLRAKHGWDSRQARAARFAYYDAAFDPETAGAAKSADTEQAFDPRRAPRQPGTQPQERPEHLAAHRMRRGPEHGRGVER